MQTNTWYLDSLITFVSFMVKLQALSVWLMFVDTMKHSLQGQEA